MKEVSSLGVNRGKQFEEQIKLAFEKVPNTTVTRLIDPQNGFAGVRNICDFIVYHYPNQLFIECKSCYGNTLPFSNITENQWEGLLKVSDVVGIRAGIVVWFIDHDETFFVPIKYLQELKDCGEKSLNINKFDRCCCYRIPGTKRRVLFDYDFYDFLGGD